MITALAAAMTSLLGAAGQQAGPPPAPSGYVTVYRSTFSKGHLGPGWGRYHGQPGSDPAGWWDPSHVIVRNSMLVLRTYRDPARYGQRSGTPWVEGGVSLHLHRLQTYGEWLVRARSSATAGVTEVMILWPHNNSWPPEIDFNESDGTNSSTATLHFGTAAQNNQIQAPLPRIDLRHWHTFGVVVRPRTISYLLDGRTWKTIRNHEHVPMDLAIQQQVWPCGQRFETCPGPTTPAVTDLEVAWVAEYAPKR